ncbi:serine protease Hayan-like [Bactrocera tryoni]|uniref:serine protease Hayan-like n=1 Tax=Bactrocera tryoni TaxID=59916 RepID=UPI001A99601F|nr:serine protease Hayan-like [Bactrocera tryoni]XP_039961786.1 serine protease Hayan-like [Bactrocera tryoni]
MFTTHKLCLVLRLCFCAHIALTTLSPTTAAEIEGNPCEIKGGVFGRCALPRDCPDIAKQMQNLGLTKADVKRCGFTIYEEIICCPLANERNLLGIFDTKEDFLESEKNSNDDKRTRGDFDGAQERKAKKACRLLDEYAEPYTVPHILGGSPVAPGEYPHMAAIGYASINPQSSPYEFRCGGALIDKRFVLTAAHCVNRPDSKPIIVRLGVTDFNNPDQMKNAVDVPIEALYPHMNYRNLEKYDDIAIIELKNDVEYSSLVFPVCLHTELADPPPTATLNVTGWGVTELKTRRQSNVLLKASVKAISAENCRKAYVRGGVLPSRGILPTQICASDPNSISDACWGDSGGPLNLIIDEAYRKMHVIGVVSAGDGCASVTPSLYTRVASYLDFIEDIVWKNL